LRASAPFMSGRCNLSCAGIGRVCGVVVVWGFWLAAPAQRLPGSLLFFLGRLGVVFWGQVLGCLFKWCYRRCFF